VDEGKSKLTESSSESKEEFLVSASALSPHDKALLKFGEKLLVGSIDTIRDFAKTMITLVSGLFAVYFALLKFLGAEDVTNPNVQGILGIVYVPPILFVLSIIAFVFGVLPLFRKLSLNDPSSIRSVRRNLIAVKYVAISGGVILFVLGMGFMLIVSLKLLFG
jgi:hypothetical protein